MNTTPEIKMVSNTVKCKKGKKKSKKHMKRMIDEEQKIYYYKNDSNLRDYYTNDNNISNISKPRNKSQQVYLDYLNNNMYQIVLATGPAGTGKTMFGCEGGITRLITGEIHKLIITRPAVSVDEEIGFLPGTLEDKMLPWMRPIYDVFSNFLTMTEIKKLLKDEYIEICPLAYMRGRTFKNCWIIADEMQNATISQMKMLLTRIGENSKLIITGDLNQHDRGFENNGLKDFLDKFNKIENSSENICQVEFYRNDVERCAVVKEILNIYKK